MGRDPSIIVRTNKWTAAYEKLGCFYLGQKMIDDEKLKELYLSGALNIRSHTLGMHACFSKYLQNP